LITGATGTGKTYTIATLAEGFSRAGVPVFLADVKGDLAGLALPGRGQAAPVQFLDVFGEQGAPVRVPLRRFGADLLARVLELSPTQGDVLGAVFATTAARLDTLADLAALLPTLARSHVGSARHGHMTAGAHGLAGAATLGAIQRALVKFRQTGADSFFGSPGYDVADLEAKPGLVSILAAERLIRQPDLYAAFLLWLLGELYERAPEVGDLDKPRLALIFDESHLLFRDAPPSLIRKIEQTVRLIRSKAIGVYFATQSPADIPPTVAAQLGNRIQHAMRAATLADRREIRGAAESLAINPKVDAAEAIATMPTGSALVSTLQDDGRPAPVELVRVRAPAGPHGNVLEAGGAPGVHPGRSRAPGAVLHGRGDLALAGRTSARPRALGAARIGGCGSGASSAPLWLGGVRRARVACAARLRGGQHRGAPARVRPSRARERGQDRRRPRARAPRLQSSKQLGNLTLGQVRARNATFARFSP
jgi:hypothetical protein